MLTSFTVQCPHRGCGWSGSLLPSRDHESWVGAVPTAATVEFRCPACRGEWRAQVVGDDVVPLALEKASTP